MIKGKSNSIFSNLKIDDQYIFKYLKTSEKINNYDYIGSTLSYNKIIKKIVLNLTYKSEIKKNKNKNRVCTGDPGERKFLVIYSNNKTVHLGKNASKLLEKKCKELDIIQSRMDRTEYYIKDNQGNKKYYEVNPARRRSLRKALHRKIEKIKNMRNEMHNKIIKYLCENFTTIILTPYEIQNMVCKLHSKIARRMYTLAYYQFLIKLKTRAKEYNVNLVIKPEHYTSQTCGKCGNLRKIEGETYECYKCGLVIDRDNNGARNILLRNIRYV